MHGLDDRIMVQWELPVTSRATLSVDDLDLAAEDADFRVRLQKVDLFLQTVGFGDVVRVKHRHISTPCRSQALILLLNQRSSPDIDVMADTRVIELPEQWFSGTRGRVFDNQQFKVAHGLL